MPQHILAATDFSAAANTAVARAARLAQSDSCALAIVHVFNELAWANVQRVIHETPLEPPADVAARDVRALADDLASRYQLSNVHAQVQIGRAAAEILALAQKMRPWLIVLGAHGEGLAKKRTVA